MTSLAPRSSWSAISPASLPARRSSSTAAPSWFRRSTSMLAMRTESSQTAGVLAEEAGRALLRHVDRAVLDQLSAAFIEAVGLPAAVLSPVGSLIAGTAYRCPACAVAAGKAVGEPYDGSLV